MLPLLFFMGLGLSVWMIGSYLWQTAQDNGPSSAVGDTGASGQVAPDATEFSSSQNEEDAEDGGQNELSSAAEAPEAEPGPVREWKLRGVVYDLLSLQPVPGCRMTFVDGVANARARSVTDSRGRYRITLPPLERRGYEVRIAKPGYAPAYLNPGTEGVSQMPPERRLELARELSAASAEPASLQPHDEAALVTDFHLAPKR